jgi:RNA polymerase sigma-70 factor, ECF subfamily
MAADPADDTEAYLRLLTEHDRWLARYVYSLVPHVADADDILQEVKLTLWRQFSKFQQGTNFKAWARSVATHAILNYRRAVKRRMQPELEEEFISAIAAELEQRSAELDHRAEALHHCLAQLPQNQRRIISWRYEQDCSISEIAEKSQRSPDAIYQLLSRIRSALCQCITQQLQHS